MSETIDLNEPKCTECYDTGVIETGNNDLPCDYCKLGAIALFNQAGVDGPITGSEVQLHFLNGSPKPISLQKERLDAWILPGRTVDQ